MTFKLKRESKLETDEKGDINGKILRPLTTFAKDDETIADDISNVHVENKSVVFYEGKDGTTCIVMRDDLELDNDPDDGGDGGDDGNTNGNSSGIIKYIVI